MRLLVPLLAVLTLAAAGPCLAQEPQVGPAPPWTLPDLHGKTLRLADYRGKVVLVNFWATWCQPCLAEIPELIKLQERFHDQPFTVIGLSVDSLSADQLAIAVKKLGMNYPVVLADENVQQLYGADQGVPISVLVDQQGMVRWAHLGYIDDDSAKELRQKIDGLLGAAGSKT